MKKVLLVLFILISVITIYGCTKENSNNEDALKFKKEYEDLNDVEMSTGKNYPTVNISSDNKVIYASYEELFDILSEGSGVIYLGYPECPWCRNAVPVLLDASKELNMNIYYMNMHDERDSIKAREDGSLEVVNEGTEGYKKLLERLDSILPDYTLEDIHGNTVSANEKRVYVPLVVFVRDGEIVGYHADTVDSQTNPQILLNEDQKNELMDIYLDLMHKVLNDVCTDKC